MPNHKSECPYIKRKHYGDESVDLCEINDKFCLLESGLECDTWNEVQREWERQGATALALAQTLPTLFPFDEPIKATPMTATILDREWRHR